MSSASKSRGRSASSQRQEAAGASASASSRGASVATESGELNDNNSSPRRDFICGIPIDHSKTFTSVSRCFPPRKSTMRRWWEMFGAETCVSSFEKWEQLTTILLFATVLTPVVWKLTSFLWFVLSDVLVEALISTPWYHAKVVPIVEALTLLLPNVVA